MSHSTKPPGTDRQAEPEPRRAKRELSRSLSFKPAAWLAARARAAKAEAEEAIPAPEGKLFSLTTSAWLSSFAKSRTGWAPLLPLPEDRFRAVYRSAQNMAYHQRLAARVAELFSRSDDLRKRSHLARALSNQVRHKPARPFPRSRRLPPERLA